MLYDRKIEINLITLRTNKVLKYDVYYNFVLQRLYFKYCILTIVLSIANRMFSKLNKLI